MQLAVRGLMKDVRNGDLVVRAREMVRLDHAGLRRRHRDGVTAVCQAMIVTEPVRLNSEFEPHIL